MPFNEHNLSSRVKDVKGVQGKWKMEDEVKSQRKGMRGSI